MPIASFRRIAVLAVAALALPADAADACRAASAALTRPLIELYTSEGCDSCPPADRWLSTTFPAGQAGANATVAAFHVDYWDRLGWKDRFATSRYTQRQYEAMRANGATFVYTPQVLVQGHEARNWQQGGARAAAAAAAKHTARAAIELTVVPDRASLRIRATATVPDAMLRKRAVLWLAYTDSGHVSDVAAGENRGVRLRHDHVVRALHGPYHFDADGTAIAALSLLPPHDRGQSAALVAFVQDSNNGDALQSLELAACW